MRHLLIASIGTPAAMRPMTGISIAWTSTGIALRGCGAGGSGPVALDHRGTKPACPSPRAA
jgi:hypothetical protein